MLSVVYDVVVSVGLSVCVKSKGETFCSHDPLCIRNCGLKKNFIMARCYSWDQQQTTVSHL